MKRPVASEETSLLGSFRALLPRGVSLLIGSVFLQCISVGVLIATGIKLSLAQGISLDDSLPPLILGGALAVVLLVTGVFLVVMQKTFGVYLCRFNAGLWTFLTGASLLYALSANEASILTLSVTGLGVSMATLALYVTRFLPVYIDKSIAIRKDFFGVM